jgi:hypothetical protein
VWLTPGRDWRSEYAQSATALMKLEFCDWTMSELANRDPPITLTELDEDVGELAYSLRDYYKNYPAESEPAAGLDGDLRAIFDDLPAPGDTAAREEMRPAGELIRRLERQLMADVFRWTGHFPERTRSLLRHLAQRADAIHQAYPRQAETDAIVGVTILVASLAMNYVHRGGYFPEPPAATSEPPAAI